MPKKTCHDNTMSKAADCKPNLSKSPRQPITGKLKGMTAMGKPDADNKGKGQAVKTVKSNPIQGKTSAQKDNSAMGAGNVIDPFI